MSNNRRGRRYEGEPKLNMKKVIGVIFAIAVLIMIIATITKIIKNDDTDIKITAKEYFAVYENGKWGVISNDGNSVIAPTYDEMIVVPNSKKAIFICTYDVNDENGEYKTKAINEKKEELYTDYDKVEAIDNYDSKQNIWFEDSVLRVLKDGKYGLIDLEGKSILHAEYDEIVALKGVSENYIVKKDGKVGLVNSKGQFIINVEYNAISLLKEGYKSEYIVSSTEGLFGVVSTSGKVIVNPEYDEIKYLNSSDVYGAKKDGKWSVVDSNNKILVTLDEGEECISAKGENIVVEKEGKFGLKKTSSETAIDYLYEKLDYAFSIYYIAKKDGKFGIININNEGIIPFEYLNMYYVEEGQILVADKTETETIIFDNNLAQKLSGIVSEINKDKGFIKLYENGEYKYYNFKFEEKENSDILTGNTLYLSKKDNKYGYLDKAGNIVVDYIYDDGTEQNSYGYAGVKQNRVWGSIDKAGKVVLEPSVNLDNSIYVDFIAKYHLSDDGLYYTK